MILVAFLLSITGGIVYQTTLKIAPRDPNPFAMLRYAYGIAAVLSLAGFFSLAGPTIAVEDQQTNRLVDVAAEALMFAAGVFLIEVGYTLGVVIRQVDVTLFMPTVVGTTGLTMAIVGITIFGEAASGFKFTGIVLCIIAIERITSSARSAGGSLRSVAGFPWFLAFSGGVVYQTTVKRLAPANPFVTLTLVYLFCFIAAVVAYAILERQRRASAKSALGTKATHKQLAGGGAGLALGMFLIEFGFVLAISINNEDVSTFGPIVTGATAGLVGVIVWLWPKRDVPANVEQGRWSWVKSLAQLGPKGIHEDMTRARGVGIALCVVAIWLIKFS